MDVGGPRSLPSLLFLQSLQELASIFVMPTLLLTPRATDDSQELWRGCVRLNWNVHRVHGWNVPAVELRMVYAEPLLATHIARTLKLELLEPTVDWLPSIPENWRKRSVVLTTMKEAPIPLVMAQASCLFSDAHAGHSGSHVAQQEKTGMSVGSKTAGSNALPWSGHQITLLT